jgi:hypothetical protein
MNWSPFEQDSRERKKRRLGEEGSGKLSAVTSISMESRVGVSAKFKGGPSWDPGHN